MPQISAVHWRAQSSRYTTGQEGGDWCRLWVWRMTVLNHLLCLACLKNLYLIYIMISPCFLNQGHTISWLSYLQKDLMHLALLRAGCLIILETAEATWIITLLHDHVPEIKKSSPYFILDPKSSISYLWSVGSFWNHLLPWGSWSKCQKELHRPKDHLLHQPVPPGQQFTYVCGYRSTW